VKKTYWVENLVDIVEVLKFIFLDPWGKYILQVFFAFFALAFNKMNDGLNGKELLFKAPKISTGATNWGMFTIGIVFAIPQYFGNFIKLIVIAVALSLFIVVVAGCSNVVGRGQKWRASEEFAEIAMYGGPLSLAIVSLTVFLLLDVAL